MDDEQLKQELLKSSTDVMNFILTGLREGTEFIQEQAPLIVQEMVTYGLVSLWFYVCTWVVIMSVVLVKFRSWVETAVKSKTFVIEAIYLILGIISLIVGVVMLSVLIPQALLVTLAPRLYILEQLKGLL